MYGRPEKYCMLLRTSFLDGSLEELKIFDKPIPDRIEPALFPAPLPVVLSLME